MTTESATDVHIPLTRTTPPLSRDAQDALAEAQARRETRENAGGDTAMDLATEINGPKGAEPTRFGDWERKGITSDF